jgi:hypothetical protein
MRKQSKFILSMMIILLCWSCQNVMDSDQRVSDELISTNLSKDGECDPKLLIGEWDAIEFAYTTDGNKLSNRNVISGRGSLIIPNEPFIENIENVEDILGDWERARNSRWSLNCWNWFSMFCSSSGKNEIEVKITCDTQVMVYTPHIEYDLYFALSKAHSFVIKGNELILYFSEVKDKELLSKCTVIKDKNLLIFKKR